MVIRHKFLASRPLTNEQHPSLPEACFTGMFEFFHYKLTKSTFLDLFVMCKCPIIIFNNITA